MTAWDPTNAGVHHAVGGGPPMMMVTRTPSPAPASATPAIKLVATTAALGPRVLAFRSPAGHARRLSSTVWTIPDESLFTPVTSAGGVRIACVRAPPIASVFAIRTGRSYS